MPRAVHRTAEWLHTPVVCMSGKPEDCRECRVYHDAQCHAAADRRTSADYLRMLAKKMTEQVWRERLIVAACEAEDAAERLSFMEKQVTGLHADLEKLRKGDKRCL